MFDPLNMPICLEFDYCLVEHYLIDEVTGHPIIEDGYFQVVTEDNFINGTKGNITISPDTYKCSSFTNQIVTRAFDSWYNFAINKGNVSKYTDASGHLVSGNGIYSPNMVKYIQKTYFFYIAEARNVSASTSSAILNDSDVDYYAWYSDTFGCNSLQAGWGTSDNIFNSPTSVTGRSSYGICYEGSQNPQQRGKAKNNFINISHELFGHAIQGGIPLSQYTPNPVPWPIANSQENGGYLAIRDGWSTDELVGGWYGTQYNNGIISEGYATLLEIMFVKYGLYRTINLSTFDMGEIDSFIIVSSLLNLSRVIARLLTCTANGDPTVGSGKGDLAQYPWTVRTFPLIQKMINMDSTQRLVFVPYQMLTYATGLIGNLGTISAIQKLHFPTDPQNFKQYNYNYWRITEGASLTGLSLQSTAMAKPRDFWTDEISIPGID